jgi:hypothetical protein
MLSDEQIANWRIVLVNMGMMKMVVDALSKEEIERIHANMQLRLGGGSPGVRK